MNQFTNMINAQKFLSQLGSNPAAAYEQLMKTNPQFAKFVEDNRDKTPEQIAKAYNIDFDLIKHFMK